MIPAQPMGKHDCWTAAGALVVDLRACVLNKAARNGSRGDLLRAHRQRSSNRVCPWVGRESSFLVATGSLFFTTLYLRHICASRILTIPLHVWQRRSCIF